MPKLRDYQLECLHSIEESTSRRQLVTLPTGTGKTVIFSEKAKRDSAKHRVLILVHRDELVRQTVAKLEAAGLDRTKYGVMKAEQNGAWYDIVIASVQTLSRTRRAKEYAAFGLAKTVIIDEAHHAPANSYKKVLETCTDVENGLRIGFTATPDRETQKAYKKRTATGMKIGVSHRSGMAQVFDEIVFYRSLTDMIAQGYLCDVVPATIETRLDLSKVGILGGDWREGELGAAMERANTDETIVSNWIRSDANGRPTLCFLPTVRTSKTTCDAFLAAGIPAAHIDGTTPIDERQIYYKQLRDGSLKVITNCMVLTEGFDEPSISCVIVARPTQSRSLFAQMIGRGTRLYPNKPDCLVMSVVGHSLDLDPITLQTFLDDPGWENEKSLSARKTQQATSITELLASAQTVSAFPTGIDDAEVEYLRQEAIQFSQEFKIATKSQYLWSKTNNIHYLAAENNRHYKVVENGLLQGFRTYDLISPTGTMLIHEGDFAFCIKEAEKFLDASGVSKALVNPKSSWRTLKPTPQQLWKADRLGIPIPKAGISRGELSDLITQIELSTEPTKKQLWWLRSHGYKGEPPTSKQEASSLIGEIAADENR
jgi:superfamily II DNA or RNA helicase